MQSLWASIADSIRKLPRHDSMTLQSLATIISAGLESRRKVIVNNSIKAWNDTFGAQDSLEYPARVRVVMKKLRPIADINLPNFPEDIDEVYIFIHQSLPAVLTNSRLCLLHLYGKILRNPKKARQWTRLHGQAQPQHHPGIVIERPHPW